MIRSAIIMGWVVLATAFFAPLAIIASFFTRTGNPVHLIARIWGQSILWVSRVHVSVKGLSNIEPDKSYVYMANHQSNFDIPVLLGCLPVQFRWLAKAELFKIPLFGRAMLGAGYVKIDRFNRKSAFESLEEAARRMRNGVSVMIFPEGTRSIDGNIRPFKKGGFVLAVDSGVPIIPIILHGTRSIMPKGQLRIQTGHVYMDIQPPMETSGYTRESKDDLIEQIRAVICEKFDRRAEANQHA